MIKYKDDLQMNQKKEEKIQQEQNNQQNNYKKKNYIYLLWIKYYYKLYIKLLYDYNEFLKKVIY